jgi:hypothetical protein
MISTSRLPERTRIGLTGQNVEHFMWLLTRRVGVEMTCKRLQILFVWRPKWHMLARTAR